MQTTTNLTETEVLQLLKTANNSENNPFFRIGYDGSEPRMGWFEPPTWEQIEQKLDQFLSLKTIKGKNTFIFSGMGGSINTVKAVEKILGGKSQNKIINIDSLDPNAIEEIENRIDDWSKVVIIGISKSGTTKETTRILKTFRERLLSEGLDYKNHFIWLTDLPNKNKIENDDWKGVDFLPIQVNEKTDIGGRFTAPHTLIFLIPLFLLLEKNKNKIKQVWSEYLQVRENNLQLATSYAKMAANFKEELFAIVTKEEQSRALETWIIQLFQESLGSKQLGYNPKTIVCGNKIPQGFNKIEFNINTRQSITETMAIMYLNQVLVAALSLFKGINFVTQPGVEIYKNKMKEITNTVISEAEMTDLLGLKDKIRTKIDKNNYKFIEVVCYWNLKTNERQKIQQFIAENFSNQFVLVFAGSDWNHHSYQAAADNETTLFVILVKDTYRCESATFDESMLKENCSILKTIAYATFKTLENKAEFAAIDLI